MGLFDIFGGGTPAEKAQKLKKKVSEKYGDPATRQKAISQLGELKSAAAVPVMMTRFTFVVEPQTTDADEKTAVFNYICDLEEEARAPVVEFLTRSESASSWALKILDAIVEPGEVIGIATAELKRLGAEYTRDPEKKEVLLGYLSDKTDERIGVVCQPFLHDMSDDVKMAAIRTLVAVKYEPAREELLKLLTTDDTAKRVQTACMNALIETGFTVQGYREKVEARLTEGHFIDKSGAVKKRGS
jgi:hypothetical protein